MVMCGLIRLFPRPCSRRCRSLNQLQFAAEGFPPLAVRPGCGARQLAFFVCSGSHKGICPFLSHLNCLLPSHGRRTHSYLSALSLLRSQRGYIPDSMGHPSATMAAGCTGSLRRSYCTLLPSCGRRRQSGSRHGGCQKGQQTQSPSVLRPWQPSTGLRSGRPAAAAITISASPVSPGISGLSPVGGFGVGDSISPEPSSSSGLSPVGFRVGNIDPAIADSSIPHGDGQVAAHPAAGLAVHALEMV